MTSTSTPEQTALPTKWFQTEQMAVASLITIATEIMDSDFDDCVTMCMLSESTNNGRKRKGVHNRYISDAGTQDETLAKLATAQESRNKSMAELAASEKDVNASQDILNKTKAVTDAEDRINKIRADRRARIEAIGGKEKLMKLRNGESQDSRCDEIDDLEERIKWTKERLAIYREALANTITPQPPASPNA
jgi:hypothetical protein